MNLLRLERPRGGPYIAPPRTAVPSPASMTYAWEREGSTVSKETTS